MDVKLLQRTSFKYNFLKSVIFRLDFLGVLQPEMEKVLMVIKPFLKSEGFNRYDERIENSVSINIDNNGIQAQRNVNQIKVFSFTNDDNGCSVDMSSNFVCLKLNTDKYIRFEEYAKTFYRIVDSYQNQLDYFVMKRLGLRKINFCFVDDIGRIKRYFSDKYFSINDTCERSLLINSRKEEHIIIDQTKMNLNYLIEQGSIEGNKMFKVSIDSDAYLDNSNDIEKAFSEEGFSSLNDIIFKVYVNALSEEMINCLTNDEGIEDVGVLGVESNEQ